MNPYESGTIGAALGIGPTEVKMFEKIKKVNQDQDYFGKCAAEILGEHGEDVKMTRS